MTTSKHPMRCTGIFLQIEILELTDSNGDQILSPAEKILLSIIDAFYCEEHGGCYASNEYLAKKVGVKENTIAKSLVKLRELHLIEDVSFNGRTRVIRSLVGQFICKKQAKKSQKKPISSPKSQSNPAPDFPSKSKAALDLNPTQTWTKIQGRPGFKSNPIYKEDKKAYRKEDPLTQTLSQTIESCRTPFSSKGKERGGEGDFFKSLEGIAMSVADKERLCQEYSEELVARAVAYCQTSAGKPRTSLDRALFYYCSNPQVMRQVNDGSPKEATKEQQNQALENQVWGQQVYNNLLEKDDNNFDVVSLTAEGVWFTLPHGSHGNTAKDFIRFCDNRFKARVESNLRKLNIW